MARRKQLVRISKRLSYLLRHHPEKRDLELDGEGYTTITVDELADRMGVDAATIREVVETDPKERFDVREGHIRANYGHSIPVGRGMWSRREPARRENLPPVLYHGTAPPNARSILKQGLKPRGRQFVHLSTDPQAARRVGSRHAERPVILRIDVGAAMDEGVEMWKAGPETVLSTEVPPECLEPHDPTPGAD